jgi:hypothetical protein
MSFFLCLEKLPASDFIQCRLRTGGFWLLVRFFLRVELSCGIVVYGQFEI